VKLHQRSRAAVESVARGYDAWPHGWSPIDELGAVEGCDARPLTSTITPATCAVRGRPSNCDHYQPTSTPNMLGCGRGVSRGSGHAPNELSCYVYTTAYGQGLHPSRARLPVVGPQGSPGEIPATAVALRLCSKSFFKVDINDSSSH